MNKVTKKYYCVGRDRASGKIVSFYTFSTSVKRVKDNMHGNGYTIISVALARR